ncbi:SIMPL domain-containing protein [Streptomyces sp. NPDC020607]|uniref:SIMPL domain-containing protein n=1 Tax=Streptomyces sp. NPDC020607 TaxID=3365082 RepID=UPI0037B81D91
MRSVRSALSVRSVSALALALAALGLPGAPAVAARTAPAAHRAVVAPAPATVSATGTGRASAAPDMAVLTAGIEVTRPTVGKALTDRSAAAEALLAAARAAGVAEHDIRTADLALSAVYRNREGALDQHDATDPRGKDALFVGHRATQMFSLTIRDIEKTGAVVRAVADAPGDASRIHSVTFDVEHPETLRAEARTSAYQDARDKAARHARLNGRGLGRLISLEERAGGRPRPVPVPVASFSKEPVPVAPGRIRDEVSVTAVYELR